METTHVFDKRKKEIILAALGVYIELLPGELAKKYASDIADDIKAVDRKAKEKMLMGHIPFLLEVDFVPDDKSEYENYLREPYRSEAIRLLDQRFNDWDALVNDKKKSFE